ncbi:unnamed protein product [Prorocentrum cordatum]|uniref:Uncharacterized protein n=1 Tax=Prorocentrum cordatum TaxID=2364126 RepID=A0ABN9VYE0_9DINO|nr:unnamed protein product [Polarella glacialis]
MSQGSPRPSRMSKILEPRALDTAMSPSPRRAAAMEAKASGIDVPAARNTRPINSVGMPAMHPKRVAESTIRYESTATLRVLPGVALALAEGVPGFSRQLGAAGAVWASRGALWRPWVSPCTSPGDSRPGAPLATPEMLRREAKKQAQGLRS